MKTAALSKTNLAYVDEGAGVPVLLVHGFPLDHTMWDAQIAALSQQARVIAPDLRGFGQSPLASGDAERGISMEAYADDLAELLDTIDVREQIVLVGFSMGGYVAWQFVRKHGHRLRALVACDTRAAADTEDARSGRIKMADNVAEWGSGRVAEIMGPKLIAPATFQKKPEVVAAVRAVVERTPPAGIAAAQRGMAARLDATDLLPHVTVPTLDARRRARRPQPGSGNESPRRGRAGSRVCRDPPGRAYDDDGRAGSRERRARAICRCSHLSIRSTGDRTGDASLIAISPAARRSIGF